MSSHDDLLQRILIGEVDPDSAEATALFERDPAARAQFEDMQRIEQALGVASAHREADVLAAREAENAPGEDLVADVIDRHLGPTSKPSHGRRFGGWVTVAAAAAALLLWWRPWAPTPAVTPDPGPTLGGSLQLEHPVGPASEFGEFRWSYDLEGAQYFRVQVYDQRDPGAPLTTSRDLDEPRWRPAQTEHEAWPEAILWEVDVMETAQEVLSESAEASRSLP